MCRLLTKCHCGFVCLPRHNKNKNQWFWGCPAFTPIGLKRKRQDITDEEASEDHQLCYCNFYKPLEIHQKRKLVNL